MKQKFWLCKRKNTFFSFEVGSRKRESLHTCNKEEAKRIIRAKNDAAAQPAINLSIAKAYLVGADSKLVERTWNLVIQDFCAVKKESTRLRRERATRSKVFDIIRKKRLVETTAEDFYAVINAGGIFTCDVLRCLHNMALGMGWILSPVIPSKLWPRFPKKHRRAITAEEHKRIIQNEANPERKLYYQLLWEIGSAQTDGANLHTENIDWREKLLVYHRKKTGELCVLTIGERLEALLRKMPTIGPLFPKISLLKDKDRAAEFRRRCRILKIEGVSLHSYRYAWAARAKLVGMPERYAQSALGHASLAVHREYARDGAVICPSMEAYEKAHQH
jgi:integrase